MAYSLGEYDQAELVLRKYLAAVPNDVRGMALLGAVNFSQSNLNQAESFLSQAVRNNVGGSATNRLLAETRLRLNKPGEALGALSDPAADESDPALMALFGRAELGLGNTDSALEYFEKGAAGVADSPVVGMSIAAGFLAAGQVERAIEVLNEIPAERDELYRREVLLIAAHLTSENKAAALKVAGDLLDSNADDPAAYSIVASLHQSLGNISSARTALEEALLIDNSHRPSLLALSRIEIESGNEVRAEQLLRKILSGDKAHIPSLITLSDLYQRQDRLPELNSILTAAIDADPSALSLRLLLIRALTSGGDEASARQAIEAARLRFPDEPRLIHAEAMTQVREGDTEGALQNLRRAVDLLPGNANFQFDLASLSFAAGDTDGALEAIKRYRNAVPDNRRGLAMHVSILIRRQDFAAARREVDRFEVRFSDTSTVTETLKGDIEFAAGNSELAATHFESAAEGRLTRSLALRLTRAYQQASTGSSQAVAALERWLEIEPEDVEIRRMLGQLLELQGRPEEAIAQYEELLGSGSNDPVVLNNLAWHYFRAGNSKAAELAARAYELSPDNGSIVDTYGWILFRQGEYDEAIALLQRAALLSPENPEIQFHLAAAEVRIGDVEKARRILERLLKSSQKFPSRNEAEKLASTL